MGEKYEGGSRSDVTFDVAVVATGTSVQDAGSAHVMCRARAVPEAESLTLLGVTPNFMQMV